MNSNNKWLPWCSCDPVKLARWSFLSRFYVSIPFVITVSQLWKIAPFINWSLIICMCSGQEALRFIFLCFEWFLGAKPRGICHPWALNVVFVSSWYCCLSHLLVSVTLSQWARRNYTLAATSDTRSTWKTSSQN